MQYRYLPIFFVLTHTIHLCAMETSQNKINYFAKLPKDLFIYLFEENIDLGKQNIPLTCKQFNETRKQCLKKINIECYGEDGYKIKFLKDELIIFGRQLVDEKFKEHIVYVDSQDCSTYLEDNRALHRTFEDFKEECLDEAKNSPNPIAALIWKHEVESTQKRFDDITTKIALENGQDFKGDKEIAHIYIQVHRPFMKTNSEWYFMNYNSEHFMNYHNIVALHYFDKIVKNEDKHSSAYVMDKIKTIIRYLDAHEYALIYFPPYYEPNNDPSRCHINVRSFFDNPEALRYMIETHKRIFTKNWDAFIGGQDLSSKKISQESKKIIEKFLDDNPQLKKQIGC